MTFLTTLLSSVLLTALAVPLLSRLALRCSLVDLPNERKIHSQPIPRIGGLAIALGTLPPILYWIRRDPFLEAFLTGGGVLVLFGLWDDWRDLRPRWKLAGQIVAAGIVVFSGTIRITHLGTLLPEPLVLPESASIALTILTIVGVTNAINLSDGLDGLAGGISLLSLSCIGYLAYLEHDSTIAIIALALCGGTFGFLRFNTYPASIFMGDVGSQLLGFSTITLALSLTQGDTPLSPVLPLIILGFPVLDTLTVMVGRVARGSSPFAADKTHFHHTLLALGLHQAESVTLIYLIQVTLIGAALSLRFYSDLLLLIGYGGFCLVVLLFFSRARSRNWQLKRMGPIFVVDEYLAALCDKALITRLFPPLEMGLICMLLLSTMLNRDLPRYAAVASLAALAAVLYLARFRRQLLGDGLKIAQYLFVPLVVYRASQHLALFPEFVAGMYDLCFAVLALLNVLVARLTRRTQGFQSTPLDFLVFIIVLAAPHLPQSGTPLYYYGLIAAKIITCYFSSEIVITELRGDLRRMTLATVSMLLILCLLAA